MSATFRDILDHDLGHYFNKMALTIDDRELTYGQLAASVVEASELLGHYVGRILGSRYA